MTQVENAAATASCRPRRSQWRAGRGRHRKATRGAMTPSHLPSRDLVLIGAGHTNLHVVRMWRMRPIPDVRLTLISPFGRATYSGMLPGTLAGLYPPDDMDIDLYRFAESCGARLIVDEAIGFEPEIRRVLFVD